MDSWTSVRHWLSPAAWLHIILWSQAGLSHLLNVSWWMGQDDGAEGSECLAILLKLLFNFAEAADLENTSSLEKSFFSEYMLYHLELLGVFTNWSFKSPALSE